MPPKIDNAKCDGCGICIFDCGALCLELDPVSDKVFLAHGRACVDCFICEEVCPEGAIRMSIGKPK
ncbi:MAG: ferredoxin [Deltaproteobacteria bacterium]|nr:ferredoxin [Deltaproteobacteria bacterium]MBI3076055.1 ferredoxin [Deltaproteobacteria bacterium]